MDAEVVARLFQPFMQADGSTTRRFGGTGLGLCISQQLACLLEGALSVSSQVGVGSIFTLWLPSRPCLVPPSLLTLAAAPVAAGGSAGVFARSHDGLRALVVDDDPTNRWLAQRQLLRLGLHADVAEDGEAGLAALLAAPYDILVTDCHMPRMDGVALTRAVRALDDPARRRIPIIGLTADATAAQRAACDAAGMTEVAIKPVTLAQFSNLITRLTGAGGSAAVDEGTTLRAVAFDDQILRAIFEPGDAAGAAWLEDYLAAARNDTEELAPLLERDPDAVVKLAHRLAGASFSAGAMLLGEAARALERAAMAGGPLVALHAAVVCEYEAAAREIRRTVLAEVAPVPASLAADG
jgi:CheY-like chemotaxis protein